jgi:hypothetical protein
MISPRAAWRRCAAPLLVITRNQGKLAHRAGGKPKLFFIKRVILRLPRQNWRIGKMLLWLNRAYDSDGPMFLKARRDALTRKLSGGIIDHKLLLK